MRPILLVLLAGVVTATIDAGSVVLEPRTRHLRNAGEREWTEFAEKPESDHLELIFRCERSQEPRTLFVRHRDVKQAWRIELNGRRLGGLPRDENDAVSTFEIAPGRILDGRNVLRITSLSKSPDDILVGEIRLVDGAPDKILGAARVSVTILDMDSERPIPGRVTIVDKRDSLAPIGARSNAQLAVRTGVVYTANGSASFGLEPGKYTLWAGRGFEYGVARLDIEARAGKSALHILRIRREVDTRGLVACDPHIHTFTHSRHGDSTLEERVITIAGEGLDLAVATDHDKHIDLEPTAKRLGVRRWFTTVVGNEVTTKRGHFNIFPIDAGQTPPDNKLTAWSDIFAAIRQVRGVRMVILNHPRDVHGGYRPFGPTHHNAVVGANLDGELLLANGMEIVNSAALHSDPMRLVHDWLGLLDRGLAVAPVGSSDSHEVWRKIVGQGRTYIECDDADPARIDVAAASRAFVEGRVSAGLGLLARVTVNGRHGPGSLVPRPDDLVIDATVQGPSWARVDRVVLFVNGVALRDEQVDSSTPHDRTRGVLISRSWSLEVPAHDVHIAVVALGPGDTWPHFTIARSYQPTSPLWKPYLLGVTGAVRVDADGDGEWSSPSHYAARLLEEYGENIPGLLSRLKSYDEAVSAQAAHALDVGTPRIDITDRTFRRKLEKAGAATRRGFERYLEAREASRKARATTP